MKVNHAVPRINPVDITVIDGVVIIELPLVRGIVRKSGNCLENRRLRVPSGNDGIVLLVTEGEVDSELRPLADLSVEVEPEVEPVNS